VEPLNPVGDNPPIFGGENQVGDFWDRIGDLGFEPSEIGSDSRYRAL
jgi:hypothetical protein